MIVNIRQKIKQNILLAICSTLMFSACSNSSDEEKQADSALSQVAVGTVYHVMTDATYPPFEFHDEKGEIVGLEVDLLKAIAKNQNFQIKFDHQDWEGFFEAFKSSGHDIAAAALTPEEASEYMDLSEAYYTSPYRIAAVDPEVLTSNLWKTKKISVPKNDETNEYLLNHNVGKQQLIEAETLYLALTNVLKGDADIAAGDSTVLQYYMNSPTFQTQGYRFVSESFMEDTPESTNIVFGVQKGNQVLLAKINQGLENLKRSGEYDKILQKWRQNKPNK